MTFDENSLQAYRDTTNSLVQINHPMTRKCDGCKEQKRRSGGGGGRWVTKKVWLCKECERKMNEND